MRFFHIFGIRSLSMKSSVKLLRLFVKHSALVRRYQKCKQRPSFRLVYVAVHNNITVARCILITSTANTLAWYLTILDTQVLTLYKHYLGAGREASPAARIVRYLVSDSRHFFLTLKAISAIFMHKGRHYLFTPNASGCSVVASCRHNFAGRNLIAPRSLWEQLAFLPYSFHTRALSPYFGRCSKWEECTYFVRK